MWAVTFAVCPAGIDATVAGSNSTFQFVGALAVIATLVTGALPVLATTSWKSFTEPALAVVERTWSGVDRLERVGAGDRRPRGRSSAALVPPLTPTLIGIGVRGHVRRAASR